MVRNGEDRGPLAKPNAETPAVDLDPVSRAGRPVRRRPGSTGMEGAFLVLSVVPAVLGAHVHGFSVLRAEPRLGITTAISCGALALAGCLFSRRRYLGLGVAAGGMIGGLSVVTQALLSAPGTALAAAVVTALVVFLALGDRMPRLDGEAERPTDRAARRARGAGFTSLAVLLVVFTLPGKIDAPVRIGVLAGALLPAILAVRWAFRAGRGARRGRCLATRFAVLAGAVAVAASVPSGLWLEAAIVWPVAAVCMVPAPRRDSTFTGDWLEPFVGQPARLLASTFLVLCAAGTLLLTTPWASAAGRGLSVSDAAFTAVSAVCVTGLIVRDTPVDFSAFGQVCILLLIQIGGLGIMTISVVALHALGRRISLRHERVLADMANEGRNRLIDSLRQVLFVALAAEGLGAAALFPLFLGAGDGVWEAAWRSLFTAVSAFCNAGFAVQSDSLLAYQSHPMILHVVAALIVVGGLSPAVTASIPGLVTGRRSPLFARLVVVTTVCLLLLGFFLFAVLEWRGTLGHMSYLNRLHNAWFQSVTLRTAGFSSVDTAAIGTPTLLVMLVFMFIGGSPGGTAGGIKTTTLAVLVAGMLSAFRGRDHLVLGGRFIGHGVVYRALAVFATGLLVWIVAVIALHLTQAIPSRDVIFEATSALGTVGLSTGATAHLDGTGKAIVMVLMFAGRVGPLTMFTVLSQAETGSRMQHPEVKIPIA